MTVNFSKSQVNVREKLTENSILPKNLNSDNLELIKKVISVGVWTDIRDVFVYDTSKDSDGGAWRKKAINTSWYTETLNTSTRGSRREFPAVAIVVAKSNQVIIYDGDDPETPMWMVFDLLGAVGASCNMIPRGGSSSQSDATSVAFLNGILVVGLKDVGGSVGEGPIEINFISEIARVYREEGSSFTGSLYRGLISERNSNNEYYGDFDEFAIVAQTVNDVAMTVLPNAKIDNVTGLPVPTIAIATDSGIAIIDDHKRITNTTFVASNAGYRFVHITKDGKLRAGLRTYATLDSFYIAVWKTLPTVDNTTNPDTIYHYQSSGNGVYQLTTQRGSPTGFNTTPLRNCIDMGDNKFAVQTANYDNKGSFGVGIVQEYDKFNTSDPPDPLVCFIGPDFNTGWAKGDVKRIYLSDTDDRNLNAADYTSEYNDFEPGFGSYPAGWVANADWSVSGGRATCSGANNGRFLYPARQRWPIKQMVAVELTVSLYSSGTLSIAYGTGAATAGTEMTANGTYRFVGEVSGNDLIYLRSDSFIGSVDNVYIYPAEMDRSPNERGLYTVGTVIKKPVNDDADLISYEGFSASNYLQERYSSDLLLGTSDFTISVWVNNISTSNSVYEDVVAFGNHGVVGYGSMQPGTWFIQLNKAYGFNMYYRTTVGTDATGWTDYSAGGNFEKYSLNGLGEWYKITIVRKGDKVYSYTNDDFIGSKDMVGSFDTSSNLDDMKLTIGWDGGSSYSYPATNSRLALLHISKSAMTSEEVAKVYNDERKLFQKNAKCTLFDDNINDKNREVTGLAYDEYTKLLHVGTAKGRSDFEGLCRINNTRSSIQTAISASNGLIVEA